MLPVEIAKRMMKKMDIVPEQFDSVTIFFSDIVGLHFILIKLVISNHPPHVTYFNVPLEGHIRQV
jgi:hypothetical protein